MNFSQRIGQFMNNLGTFLWQLPEKTSQVIRRIPSLLSLPGRSAGSRATRPTNMSTRYNAEIGMYIDLEDSYEFARMRDISDRGFQAQLYSNHPRGSRLHFVLEGPRREFRCLGQVMWVEQQHWFPRRTWVAGIRIIGNKVPRAFIEDVKKP
jgi:hypothetical protein